jgi:hypothetical protein
LEEVSCTPRTGEGGGEGASPLDLQPGARAAAIPRVAERGAAAAGHSREPAYPRTRGRLEVVVCSRPPGPHSVEIATTRPVMSATTIASNGPITVNFRGFQRPLAMRLLPSATAADMPSPPGRRKRASTRACASRRAIRDIALRRNFPFENFVRYLAGRKAGSTGGCRGVALAPSVRGG